jgi:hypothetical protein
MRKIKSLIVAMLATVSLAGAAHAINIPVGDVTFHWTNYETRVTAAGQTLSGVFTLDQIGKPLAGGGLISTWNQGAGGEYLYGLFTDLTVQNFGGENPGAVTTFTGGTLEVYKLNSAFDLTNDGTVYADLRAAGGGLSNAWLTASFASINPFGTTLVSSVKNITTNNQSGVNKSWIGINSSGDGYLDVTGGTMKDTFDTNSIPLLRPDLTPFHQADFTLANTFSILNVGQGPLNHQVLGWDVVSSDPITGSAVPEPGTMALFGIGLLGMAIYGKRKINA